MIRHLILALCLVLAPAAGMAQLLAPQPKAGLDYDVLPTPQPTFAKGKIEVAEVFSYGCVHCFHFQPEVNAWKKTMPADVRWEYVPAAFGGPFDAFARAYFAAQILGVQARTHDAVFKAIFVDHVVKTGTPEEIADMYAKFGVNRQKFLDTMAGDQVKARFAAAREFGLRTGIEGTPTLIVNGKYRIAGRAETGYPGMFRTLEFVLDKERAAAKAGKAVKKP